MFGRCICVGRSSAAMLDVKIKKKKLEMNMIIMVISRKLMTVGQDTILELDNLKSFYVFLLNNIFRTQLIP
jgi:hypothetical protein